MFKLIAKSFKFIYSCLRISLGRYPEGSLSKSYRIGNRLLRAEYCNWDGEATPEKVLFENVEQVTTYQSYDENIYFIRNKPNNLLDLLEVEKKKRLTADVFYKLVKIEPQKTPHSCSHAASFMVMDYARYFFKKNPSYKHKNIQYMQLNKLPNQSGYDDGAGLPWLTNMGKYFGLFKDAMPMFYGLTASTICKKWPKNHMELSQYLAYLLFVKGPLCLEVKNSDEPYSHYITLTAIIMSDLDGVAKVIYADPWEGQMMVEQIDTFAPQLYCAAEHAYHSRIHYEAMPYLFEASFFRRMSVDYRNHKTIEDDEQQNEHELKKMII